MVGYEITNRQHVTTYYISKFYDLCDLRDIQFIVFASCLTRWGVCDTALAYMFAGWNAYGTALDT